MTRRIARTNAMKLVYEWDMGGEGGELTINGILEIDSSEPEYEFMNGIVEGVKANCTDLDAEILKRLDDGWTIDRLPKTDLAILRVAVYELLHTDTEAKFVINEAVLLSKEYSADKSSSFINGLLGSLNRGE